MAGSKWFWDLIDLGLTNPEELERRITELPESELVDFYWFYEQKAADLKDDEFTENLAPTLSEDTLDDLAQWIVAQGLKYYEEIMLDPEKMPTGLPPDTDPPPWTGIVMRTYRRRYGQPMRLPDEPPPPEPS